MKIDVADPDMQVNPMPVGEWSPDLPGYSQEVLDFLTVSDIHLVHVNQDGDTMNCQTYAGIVMYQGIPRMVVTVIPTDVIQAPQPMTVRELFGENCIWVLAARIDLPS